MKSSILKIILSLIFLVLFNVPFFLLCGTQNSYSVWISYGFIHFSYFAMFFVLLFRTKGEAGYYLTTTSLVPVWCYFLLELVLGIACILWNPEDFLWPLLSQAILAGIFITTTVMHMLAGEATANSLQKREQEVKQYKDIVMDLRTTITLITDVQIKSILNECYSILSTGSMRTTEATQNIDADMSIIIELIKQNATASSSQLLGNAQQLLNLSKQRREIQKYSH